MKSDQDNNACKNKCPCMEDCPLGGALRLIGGKWKVPILCALNQDGTTRYNELKRKIRGITNTMLASSLKELEEDGLICRKQYMEMPVRVEYALTDLCSDLMPILRQLAHWGIQVQESE
ncbi:winged helix-turn-helix transcriptional regulator [Dehalobacter sp. UNSWDHB]|uniref:winged helix-turn-helix transcriptional regulator n=1 Tax=Dehalobacter sp. UNSWDHB TaxID=1339256 RepID=UPI00054E1429|nr:helix-turn-helix domain-containing protein [Dehalobacter sp. UNSWDHB]